MVLKLDRGELPRVYDLGYDPAAIGDGEEEDDDDAVHRRALHAPPARSAL